MIKTWRRFDNENSGLIIHILYKRHPEIVIFLFWQYEILDFFFKLSLINTLLLSFQVRIARGKKKLDEENIRGCLERSLDLVKPGLTFQLLFFLAMLHLPVPSELGVSPSLSKCYLLVKMASSLILLKFLTLSTNCIFNNFLVLLFGSFFGSSLCYLLINHVLGSEF